MVSMAAGHIDFWFTMGSTYSYLSVMRLVQLERLTGIKFRWRPFHLLVILFAINIKNGDAVAPAAHKTDGGRVGELAGNLAAGDQSKLIISADHRPLTGIDGKRRDTMRGIVRLPMFI